MTDTLELRLEGQIVSRSGKLLVIDPAYLTDFDWSPLEQLENKSAEHALALRAEEMKTHLDYLKATSKCLRDSMVRSQNLREDKQKFMGVVQTLSERLCGLDKDHEKKCAEIGAKKAAMKADTIPRYLIAPYVGQMNNGVVIRNPIGDGDYPVLGTPQRFHIVFDYPIEHLGDGRLRLNKEQLRRRGTLLGISCVDSGTQLVIDPSHVRIRDDVSSKIFCTLHVPAGVYACKFTHKNYVLSIRRTARTIDASVM